MYHRKKLDPQITAEIVFRRDESAFTFGNTAVVTVAGWRRRLVPAIPPAFMPLLSKSAGVCRAPAAAIARLQRISNRHVLFRPSALLGLPAPAEVMTTPVTWRLPDVEAALFVTTRSAYAPTNNREQRFR